MGILRYHLTGSIIGEILSLATMLGSRSRGGWIDQCAKNFRQKPQFVAQVNSKINEWNSGSKHTQIHQDLYLVLTYDKPPTPSA